MGEAHRLDIPSMKPTSLSLLAAAGVLLPALTATAEPVVTVVKVAKPWYLPSFLLTRKFRETIPQYAAIPGLAQKYYTVTADGRFFGGIYLWTDRAAAEAWFTPAWFQKVRELRGTEAQLEYFAAPALERRAPSTSEGAFQATLITRELPAGLEAAQIRERARALLASEAPAAGLLRRYAIVSADAKQIGLVSLWADAGTARAQLANAAKSGAARVESFAVPVQTPGGAGDRVQP